VIVFSARGRHGVRQLHFLPDGELAAGTGTGFGTGLCVWDLDTRALRIDDTETGFAPYLFSPDGRSVIRHTTFRGTGVYSLTEACWDGEPLHLAFPRFLLWSPDGQTLMVGNRSYVPTDYSQYLPADSFVRVADGKPGVAFLTRQVVRDALGRNVCHSHATVSPDGRRAVTYSEATLHVYDLTADRLVKEIHLPILYLKPGLFTLDGSRFLVWAAFKIYAIDLDTGKVAISYPACPRAVHGATLTPDGRHLLQVSADRTVRVLDVATGRLVKDYAWEVGKLNAVAVSPDGLLAACGGTGGKVVVWDLDL